MPGTVILHIGRNKAGSTTLQDMCRRQQAHLAEHGILYCLFGHLAHAVPGIPGFAHAPPLADFARANPGKTLLVSNEFMFGWPDIYTEHLIRDLSGLDVSVLAYIRPYADWLAAAYAEAIVNGETAQDFETYAARMDPDISALPHLHAYARALSWPKLRIRSLDPRALKAGDLIADFRDAIGLPPDRAPPEAPANASDPWPVLEILKTCISRESQTGWSEAQRPRILRLRATLRHLVLAHEPAPPPAIYGTAPLRAALNSRYNHDLLSLQSHTNLPLPPAAERLTSATPSLALISPELRRRMEKSLLEYAPIETD